MKKLIKLFTSRLFITACLILFQLGFMFSMLYRLHSYSMILQVMLVLISLFMAIIVINDDSNPAFKLAWIIPMLIAPFFGWLLYLIFHRRHVSKKTKSAYMRISIETKKLFRQDESVVNDLKVLNKDVYRLSQYIRLAAHTGISDGTSAEFFPTGEDFFTVYLEKLRSAEKFIFIEYFIIAKGRMWDEVLDILTQKAAEGVDVRIMYDDLGTINLLEKGYDKNLKKRNIKVCIFNPFRASLDTFMNYRDHRKITVIDGKYGFTGGLNLADEYINARKRFGHWKDCALMLEGCAVSSMTLMFLRLWYFTRRETERVYEPYLTEHRCHDDDGYFQPFGDGPMDGHLIGKNSYMSVINNAVDYVYITTPYLILDNEMTTALKLAAESGVDVRIITPRIPDKSYVHAVTRSNYAPLLRAGVRIYEYLPGFIHAKMIVSDNHTAIVGTSNFDFRSFYLHFENGVFIYKSSIVNDIYSDFVNTMHESEEITPEFCTNQKPFTVFSSSVLKIFSPFM